MKTTEEKKTPQEKIDPAPGTMLKDLAPGKTVTGFFICARKTVRTDRNGNRFLSLRLTDASGGINAVMWQASEAAINAFSAHNVVKVQGIVSEDNYGDPQLKLEKIRAAGAGDDFNLAGLMRSSPRNLEEMEAELGEIRGSIRNADLAALLDEVFGVSEMYRAFCDAPAAKGFHHDYLHGLLEHTVSVCRVTNAIAGQYPEASRDLLVAGAILHDIGKTEEFDYETAIDYSDSGRLLGHIVLGEKIVADAIGRLEHFPEELGLQLRHLILSHHGEYEYGSPKRPKTLEAFILNHADDVDAKANAFMKKRADSEEPWSEYDRVLGRFLYLKKVEE